jgi:plastocyanin
MTKQTRIAARLRTHLAKATLSAALVTPLIATLVAAPAAFAQPAGHEYTVTINNMEYGAMPDGAKVGDSIVWVNRDSVLHSVTARDHSFDIRLNPGQQATMKLGGAGRIAIYCLFHPNMRASLTVAAK